MTTYTLHPSVAFALLDHQPEAIFYYTPVWDETGASRSIQDFEVVYCNQEAASILNLAVGGLLGQRIRSIAQAEAALRERLFGQIAQVYETGMALQDQFHNPVLDRYFNIRRTKVEDGVLTVVRDTTREVRDEQEKDRQRTLASSILDTSLNGIFACEAVRNAAGEITDLEMKHINRAFTQLVGLSEAEVIGKTYLTFFPSSRHNGTFDMNCRVIETGVSAHKEMYYEGDNLDAWYDIALSKLGADGLLVTFSNITEQKKAFLQVEQQKTLLDNILQHSANGISVTELYRDENGHIIDGKTILANEAAVRFTGLPREIYLSKRATEIDPDIIHSAYFQLCIKTMETGESQFSQYYLAPTQRWLEITASRLDTDHIITIFTDVTQAKEAQLRQEQLVDELKRSNANLEEFAHAASHDLKEPVRKVHFFTERLKGKLGAGADEETTQLLSRMENAAERMRLLIDDLLEYSHVSHDSSALEDVDLNRKLQLVLTDLELPMQEKGAAVHAGKLPVVKGYRRQLQQLFQNLIGNALKYSKPDVPPVIDVTATEVLGKNSGAPLPNAEAEKMFYLIAVRDNGIGFEPEDAERIFNMFQRLHGKHEYGGTGIGLAIVRKVAANHGGYIWAESRAGEGATFKLLLPVH